MQMKVTYTLLIALFLLFSQQGWAQSNTVKGTVVDTVNANTLSKSSIILLRAKDSVLIDYTRTDDKGAFVLHSDTLGKYILMNTFPGFADFVDIITVKNEKPIDLGRINMISKSHLLSEFVLKQQIGAIKIKGDTTEYVADSFKVRDNATVEDLLKRMPGLQVNKNGEVVAQGEKVEKILVDGEEFFSDDPAVVIKNLQANAIDKVQVYDKKSDQANFTGIDDGQKTKTINLQLKEDKKKGYFGKIDAGGGTNGYFQDQGMINSFRGKKQFSAFGIMSNTGQVGLGWQDRDKFSSGGGSTAISDDGGIMISFDNNNSDPFQTWNGKYNGEGLPSVWTGGLHFADKWNEDKYHVNGNYRLARQNVEIVGNTTTQNAGTGFVNRESRNQFSTGDRHSVDMMYEWKIDSSSSIKLSADAGYKGTRTTSFYNTDVTDSAKDVLSNTKRNINSDATTQNINADLLYRKKFAKKGRTISVDIKENYEDAKNDGHLYSDTHSSFLSKDSIVDQKKNNTSNKLTIAAKATYTEPLSKVTFLELDYGVTINNSTSERKSFDAANGKYDVLNPVYSNNYSYNIFTHTGGAALRFVYKKTNFSFGTDMSSASFKQKDLITDSVTTYNYVNIFPKATFNYKLGKQKNFYINYYGTTRQPSIDQIQPLKNNTDPMNIAIGNTNLKQEFRNTISARYNDYKILTNRYLWSGATFNFINDAITRSDTINAFGNTKYTYINASGNYNAWGYIGYGFKLQKLDLDMGITANTGINHIKSFVTTVSPTGVITSKENINDNNSYTGGLEIRYNKEKKFSLSFEPNVTYNDNKATISKYTTSYWTSDNTLDASVDLPAKFVVGSTFEWFIRQETALFPTNNNVMRWKAYVSKKFLKNSQLELRATMFDILNQNKGFERDATNGTTYENRYNTIGQYGMLSLIWNFTKAGIAAAPPTGGVMITR
jgi:Outer membrane protein beta-barrel family